MKESQKVGILAKQCQYQYRFKFVKDKLHVHARFARVSQIVPSAFRYIVSGVVSKTPFLKLNTQIRELTLRKIKKHTDIRRKHFKKKWYVTL